MADPEYLTSEDCAWIRVEMDDIHALRVALEKVRQGETVSAATQRTRVRFSQALSRAEEDIKKRRRA